jgi:hypothetical protein
MGFYLGKFVHTESGKYIMSLLLGFGLASLFRTACKGNSCIVFHAAPLEKMKDKIYKSNGKCVKYNTNAAKCDTNFKTVDFE